MRKWIIMLPTESQALRFVMTAVALFFVLLIVLIIPACVEEYVGRIPENRPNPQKGSR